MSNTNSIAFQVGKAVVTGASTGIGALYAERLAQRGHDLILVARNEKRLNELAARITRQTGRDVEVIAADLTQETGVARVEELLRTDELVTLLVNNAGVGSSAPFVGADEATMHNMITLNVNVLTRLAQAVLPGFVQRQNGALINIASIVSVAPELLNAVYSGSKAYVLALSQALRHELQGKGVRVQVVLPGATATEFWDVAGTPVDQLPAAIVMPASAMVDAALAGFDQGEFVTIPALPDAADWDRFEAARQALAPNLSHSKPAERYLAVAEVVGK